MKKSLRPLMFLMSILCFMAFAKISMAQAPPLPPSTKGSSTNEPPQGAPSPIDPGTGIFLILAAGYGLKKAYDVRRKPAR